MRVLLPSRVSTICAPARIIFCVGILALAGCDDAGKFNPQQIFNQQLQPETADTPEATSDEFLERDVEAPDVFSAKEDGLWDGRPSLGGVWVAHPDADAPERVMIRNTSTGESVVGALFRRERDIPGPRLQISSDAAKALNVLAGSPVDLEVVALRKERVPVAPRQQVEAIDAPSDIQQTTLDPIAAAAVAIETAEPTPTATPAQAPLVESNLPVSRLDKPYIQVGIYNQKENAERVAAQMRTAGMVPTVRSQQANDKAFWRVVVGPASSAAERRTLQQSIQAEGFSDAYAVSN